MKRLKTCFFLVTAMLFFAVIVKVKAQSPFTVNEYAIDLKKYPVYPENQVQSAIISVKSSKFFDYHYLNSGCNYKSHYISLWLKKKLNIETFKVWNFSKSLYYYNGYNEQLSIKDPLGLSESGKIFWGFHVAVGVLVSKTDKEKTIIDTLIIDLPTDEYNPVPLKVWLDSQNQTNAYYTFTDKKYCNFESIIPALMFNNELQRYNLSKEIFSGKFWDDFDNIKKDGPMAKTLATDIIVMKYFNEIVLKDPMRNQLITQRGQIEQNVRQARAGQKTELEIQNEIRQREDEITQEIRKRSLVLTEPIANYGNLKLPDSYNNQLPDLTVKIRAHLDTLIK